MFDRKLYVAALVGLFMLSGVGVYFGNPKNADWTDWVTEKGRWVLLLANLLFLVLAFRQLWIWNISVGESEVYLNRFLGLKKIALHETDFITFTVELDKDPWWMKNPRTTIILNLQTTKGNLVFNSSDYYFFESQLAKLFSQSREMHIQCFRQISKLKTKAEN